MSGLVKIGDKWVAPSAVIAVERSTIIEQATAREPWTVLYLSTGKDVAVPLAPDEVVRQLREGAA